MKIKLVRNLILTRHLVLLLYYKTFSSSHTLLQNKLEHLSLANFLVTFVTKAVT